MDAARFSNWLRFRCAGRRTLHAILQFGSKCVSIPQDYAGALRQSPCLIREAAIGDDHGSIGAVKRLSCIDDNVGCFV